MTKAAFRTLAVVNAAVATGYKVFNEAMMALV